ncbi:hypothetical protein ACTGZW_08380, partial [Streptococcus suis]
MIVPPRLIFQHFQIHQIGLNLLVPFHQLAELLSQYQLLILFKKQKLTYNRFMKLTIEQTKELKTYLKDKTYSPFHRRLQV